MGGCWILLEKFLNRVDYIHSLTTSANANGKTHATIFIHPHMMRVLGSKELSGTVCRS